MIETEEGIFDKRDYIIIQEIENMKFLYHRMAYVENVAVKNQKMDAYKAISKRILKETNTEMSWTEVKSRWQNIRRGYNRSLRDNSNYYLSPLLTFLKPHIHLKPTKPHVYTPYVPLRLSPIDVGSDTELSDNEEFSKQVSNKKQLSNETTSSSATKKCLFNDTLSSSNTPKKHILNTTATCSYSDPVSKISKIHNAENVSAEHEKMGSYNSKDDAWDAFGEIEYLNALKQQLQKIPEKFQVQCMLEIFESAQDYINQI